MILDLPKDKYEVSRVTIVGQPLSFKIIVENWNEVKVTEKRFMGFPTRRFQEYLESSIRILRWK